MQIHELNTKALTDPAWVPFDDGSDTYKADFNQIIDDAVAEAFTDADVSGGVVEYESEDAEPLSDASWSDFDLFEGGESLKDLFTLVSEMAYNVRWIHLQINVLPKSIKANNRAWSGTSLEFTLPQSNTALYRFIAMYGNNLVELYFINRADGTIYSRNQGNASATPSYNSLTSKMTITFPSSGYWIYRLDNMNVYN